MDRKEILSMGEEKLLDLVHDRFGVKLGGLEDTKYLSAAWEIVEKMERDGWTTDIRIGEGLKRVDGYKFDGDGPGTIFAQYGHWPSFNSVIEGICKTALIAYEEN